MPSKPFGGQHSDGVDCQLPQPRLSAYLKAKKKGQGAHFWKSEHSCAQKKPFGSVHSSE
jgi:hypothetical protein